MLYHQIITLRNGAECCLRNGTQSDGQAVLDNLSQMLGQTDYLLSYPDEMTLDAVQEGEFLKRRQESERELLLLAVVNHEIVGNAGISAAGSKAKVRHRAQFGVSVAEAFWGLGIGQALTAACIDCARNAGYLQLELEVVADNERAISMYRRFGFTEYGRNPRGLLSRTAGLQELVSMRLEL